MASVWLVIIDYNKYDDALDSIWTTEEAANARMADLEAEDNGLDYHVANVPLDAVQEKK